MSNTKGEHARPNEKHLFLGIEISKCKDGITDEAKTQPQKEVEGKAAVWICHEADCTDGDKKGARDAFGDQGGYKLFFYRTNVEDDDSNDEQDCENEDGCWHFNA